MTAVSVADVTGPFRHEALLYDTVPQFLDTVVPFLDAGVRAGEPVLVILDRAKSEQVRARLRDPSGVEFADMAVVGDNPARILSCWLDFIARTDDPTVPARGVGEPIGPTRAGDVLTECQIHEALLNVAFDAQPRRVQLLCPYDTSVLADDVVEEARRSHPFVRVGTAAPDPSADYLGADLVDDLLDRPLPPPPLDAIDLTFTTGSLSSVRREVSAEASRRGLHGSRRLDFELAVAEVAANALLHGGGAGRLQLWGDGTAVVAEVSDRGRFSDLLAGRVRPTADQIGGRGLWIVQQVCDLVQIRSHAGRTAVRLHMRR